MIKNINNKMTTNSQLSTTEPINTKTKRTTRTRTRITEMEITWRVINRGVGGGERRERY